MRLIAFELSGYRRFVHAQVNLDAHVIAVLGPNEAGKSSLLEALNLFSNDDPIPLAGFWRGLPPPPSGQVVLAGLFLIDPDDRRLFAGLKGHEGVRWLKVSPDPPKLV